MTKHLAVYAMWVLAFAMVVRYVAPLLEAWHYWITELRDDHAIVASHSRIARRRHERDKKAGRI